MVPAQPARSRRLTYADYCLIPEDGKKHEIIDGIHYVSPAPRYIHQQIVVNLVKLLGNWADETKPGIVLVSPFDILLSDYDVVQPDVLFIANENREILNEKNAQGAPDLAIEVLSPSNPRYDKNLKYQRYEHFGVKEYWIVDPDMEEVCIFHLVNKGYQKVAILKNEETGVVLQSELLPGFSEKLEDVFYRP